MNWIDIAVIALIVFALAAAIIGIIKRKKRGCGCNCKGCPLNCEHRK